MMFPVAQIAHQNSFDISLKVGVTELKTVTVMPRNYKFDSTENRKDYAKIFDFRKPGFKLSEPSYNDGLGVGVDLDELINVFRFKRTKRILLFRKDYWNRNRINLLITALIKLPSENSPDSPGPHWILL